MSVKYDEKVCFDSIPIGTNAVQSYLVENGAKHPNWSIGQYPGFDIALNAFTLKKKITKHSKTDKHEIIIEYKPLQPHQTHINYYLIKNIGEKDVVLCVSGYSTGLSVQSSVRYINFFRLKNDFKTKTVFELRNNSKCTIKFQFDIDNNQNIFEINPDFGEILPGKYLHISAQFITEKIGIFFLDLACLILYHQPIYIELLGVNKPKTTESHFKQLKGQCSKISLENGYKKFMSEEFGSYNMKPICSITPSHLDFSLKMGVTNQLPEILNYTDYCLQILWDTDQENDFTIFPDKFYIRKTERCCFETKFEPKNLEKFFGCQLYGRAFIFGNKKKQEDPDTIILPISIRCIGSSFDKTQNWLPSVQICPQFILMPVCIQNKSVYSTFYIRKQGNYPAIFKFLPPKKSAFTVKPMVGLINNVFQLIVVKFSSGNTKNGIFQEKWKVEFNHKKSEHFEIIFKAFVEEPKLLIGENDQLNFGTVFPGCKKYLKVDLVNKTQNKIKFLFQNNKWFNVKTQEEIIDSFGKLTLTWCFTADCDVEELTDFFYEMRVVQENKVILGAPYIGKVQIFAKCAYGKLCSSPMSYDFQTIVCAEPVSTSFTLFNFSEVTLHFLLKINEHFGMSNEEAVSVDPSKGSLSPGDHLEVTVTLLTYYPCLRTYCIQYLLRESRNSNVLVESKGKTFPTTGTLFRIDYYSFYPTLKFTEIALNTTGPLFGKLNVWEYFDADRFNEILRTIRINEVKRYNLRIPDAEAGLEIKKSIMIIVKNVTREDTYCKFERKKICDCELKEVQNTSRIGSFRKYNYENCPHRKLITIQTSEEIVKAYETIYVEIEINYVLAGDQQVCFLMHLSHNRTVEIYFEVIGLCPGQLSTYSNGLTLRMNSVFIGELCPDLQIYWFLNNTRTAAHYQLDLAPLRALNHRWGHAILTCINPEGFVDAKTIGHIQFLFAPVSAGMINLELPFQFGAKCTTLSIVGNALPYFTSPLEQFYYTEIGREYHNICSLFINISTEHIVFRAIPTHCTSTRLLTLRNVTNNATIGYTFDSYYLEGTLSAWISPSSGLLSPAQRVALILHVETGGVACAIRITMTCHLVDHTALQKHLSTTTEFYRQADSRNDQFCVGENGVVTYPSQPTVEIAPAPKVFHRTLAVTLHIIPQADLDTKMTIQDQLKQTPFHNLPIYHPSRLSKFLVSRPKLLSDIPIHAPVGITGSSTKSSKKTWRCRKTCCVTFKDDEYVAVHTVLSCLLRDILSSKEFKHLVKVLADLPHRYYSEFNTRNLSEEEEKTMLQLAVNRIPNMMLSQTMQILLADCVLKQFDLGQLVHKYDECVKDLKLMKHGTLSFGKLLYTEKFVFLLDHL